MKSINEAFFLKKAMEAWRGNNLRYEKIKLVETLSDYKGLYNFTFAEIARNSTQIDLESHEDYLEKGSFLWAENDSLVNFKRSNRFLSHFKVTTIVLSKFEDK